MPQVMPQIVLASTSPYRKQLLQKLGLPFQSDSPNVDETPLPGESPQQLVERLSRLKVKAVSEQYADALIIGSDQVATFAGKILGKPGTHEKAVLQLNEMSGQSVTFYTGLCLYNAQTGHEQLSCIPFTVHFKSLDKDRIERYLRKEQPYNCAGSFKSEGLGIALFEKLEGDDPNTLVGLPLIELVRMLEKEGIIVP